MQKKIIFLVLFFFTTSYAMDQNDSLDHEVFVKPIAAKKLHKYENKVVLYKESENCYKAVILGQKISGSNYYQVYTTGDRSQGICCSGDKFFKSLTHSKKK